MIVIKNRLNTVTLFLVGTIFDGIIGDHMQEHVGWFELSVKPRRLLVGGIRVRQMLIVTPLLQEYLNHGMVVTKIYQQWNVCTIDVAGISPDNRRIFDALSDKAIIGDTSKLHGNSSNGGTIMDQ